MGTRLIVSALVLFAFLAGSHRAAGQQPLRWGGDQEGGGPYIYPEEDNPDQLKGFEIELAAAIAEELGRKDQFVQGTWDQLLAMLSRGDVDLVLNGYEYLPERAQRYLASYPYYIYELALGVRGEGSRVKSWDDLKRRSPGGAPWRVAVLGGSAADRYLTDEFGDTCTVLRFEGSTEALHVLRSGQIDATVQDLPILEFYINQRRLYPELAIIDKPVAPGYYVAFVRPKDEELVASLNTALQSLYENGRLRDIYERNGIWNDAQERLPEVWKTWDSHLQTSTTGKVAILQRQVKGLLLASLVTIALSLLSMPLAVLIGLAMALIRGWETPALGGRPGSSSPFYRILRAASSLYVEVVRGTPLAFQLFVVYFVLPDLGLTISPFWSGVIGLAINYSAYESEIFRLGLQAIPKGQMEAAMSLGMPRWLAIRRIILPQAVRLVIPATANDFIALFKDTAVCSVIAVQELSKTYSMAAKNTGLFIEMALMTSVLYLAMSYPLSIASRWLEERLKREGTH